MNDVQFQRDYYENNLNKPAMQQSHSDYVLRHLERTLRKGGFSPKKTLLEVGSGLGKFTMPLLEKGYNPVCLDISPVMLEHIQKNALPHKVPTILSDIAEASQNTTQKFEQAIGFFTLHHMSDLEKSLQGLSDILEDGGRAVFCEPRAYNPLYYLQIAFTPRMHWSAEKGIVNMRKRYLITQMKKAGFTPIEVYSYGFFPPFIMNKAWGKKLNDYLETLPWLSFGHAFQIFVMEKSRKK